MNAWRSYTLIVLLSLAASAIVVWSLSGGWWIVLLCLMWSAITGLWVTTWWLTLYKVRARDSLVRSLVRQYARSGRDSIPVADLVELLNDPDVNQAYWNPVTLEGGYEYQQRR